MLFLLFTGITNLSVPLSLESVILLGSDLVENPPAYLIASFNVSPLVNSIRPGLLTPPFNFTLL
ncbi:MAG: Uncharacterised protein [Bacteroidia bacterium]|nr:MAG: Uncharacterised protein [Bacteroidia bacterium]